MDLESEDPFLSDNLDSILNDLNLTEYNITSDEEDQLSVSYFEKLLFDEEQLSNKFSQLSMMVSSEILSASK